MRGLDRLLELQAIDTATDRASARLRALEAGGELASARVAADGAEAALGEARLAIDAAGRDQRRLEHEIDSLSQKATAEERRLYDGSIANAKELGSLQHEVENLRRRRSEREDELLEVLEQLEGLEATAREREATATALRARLEDVGGDAAREIASLTDELRARREERAALLPAFDDELVELYEDVRAQKKGIGAAALVDGVCQGCHEKLSAMELDKLRRAEGVKRCEYCRRILIPSPSS
jgi:predicted  nucleic acid-binding Zn-ribbon protein